MNRIFALILLIGSGLISAKEKKIELPAETPVYQPGKGTELIAGYCLTCHSAEYFTTQPPLPRKAWEAIVIKMRDKFGAPILEANVAEITDYLSEHYGEK